MHKEINKELEVGVTICLRHGDGGDVSDAEIQLIEDSMRPKDS